MPMITVPPFVPLIMGPRVLSPREVMPSDSNHTSIRGIPNPSGSSGVEGVATTLNHRVTDTSIPIDGRLAFFADRWDEITSDLWIKHTVRSGLALEFLSTPPRFFIRCPVFLNPVSKVSCSQQSNTFGTSGTSSQFRGTKSIRGFTLFYLLYPRPREWGGE